MTTPTNTCEDCRFFEADKDDESTGACRRHPPTVVQLSDEPKAVWPVVDIDDWCGDYQNDGSAKS